MVFYERNIRFQLIFLFQFQLETKIISQAAFFLISFKVVINRSDVLLHRYSLNSCVLRGEEHVIG